MDKTGGNEGPMLGGCAQSAQAATPSFLPCSQCEGLPHLYPAKRLPMGPCQVLLAPGNQPCPLQKLSEKFYSDSSAATSTKDGVTQMVKRVLDAQPNPLPKAPLSCPPMGMCGFT